MRTLTLIAVTLALASPDAAACTTFLQTVAGQAPLVAKSYDWHDGGAMVVANKRGVDKVALALGGGEPHAWRSRYASLTFNQFGREQPNGGMNEAGLVVEIMWLADSEPASPDARPTISELQWIQHALDRFGSVSELVASANQVRIAPIYAAVHYLACDATGACAAVELVDGAQIVTSDPGVCALTNHTLAASRRHVEAAGESADRGGVGSLSRFARVASRASTPLGPGEPGAVVAATFATLDAVKQAGGYSKWQIVYDTGSLTAHFRTHGSSAIKSVAVTDFGTSCAAPVRILDIDHPTAGPADAAFVLYSSDANRRRVTSALGRLRVPLPGLVAGALSGYPESTTCAVARTE